MHRTAVIVEEMMSLLNVPDETAFRRQHNASALSFDGFADDLLRQTLAVGRRRIDQRNALVDRGLDGVDRIAFIRAAPHPAADRPGAKPDGGGINVRPADLA